MPAAATFSSESSAFAGIADLKVGDAFYSGWKSLRATRSIEQMSGQFDVGVAERWSDSGEVLPIRPGMACQLLLDQQPVITGWIDDVNPSYDASSHGISISGRDKTADLVDCSAIHKTGQWKNASIERIARDLLAPFKIFLVMQANAGKPFPSYDVQPGETVFECLDRAARLRALLLTSNAEGALVITRASETLIPVVLEEGKNIKAASGQFSWKDRFSAYILRSQDQATDESYGENVAHVEARVSDDTVTRYRPLIVLAEDHGNTSTLHDRAEWERNVRCARGNRATITVQGWRRPDGVLWAPNVLVRVVSPKLWLDAEMLIVGCSYTLDDRGTLTELTIVHRLAFTLVAGIGMSRLERKLNDKMPTEKKKKGAMDWSLM